MYITDSNIQKQIKVAREPKRNHGAYRYQGNTESRKTLEQKFIFQIGTLNPEGINERFSFN